MSFIVENEITIVGMFSQNGFQTIQIGTPVDIVFDNAPGHIYRAKIEGIPRGVGQGQIAVSGTLVRTNAIGGASAFPVEISVPADMSRESRCETGTAHADLAGEPGNGPVGGRIRTDEMQRMGDRIVPFGGFEQQQTLRMNAQ